MRAHHYLLTRPQQSENLYGAFTQDILVAEGFNGFDVVDLDRDGLPEFQPSDTVLLTRCFLREKEIDQLLAAVERGCGLVCLMPAPRLAARFGWEPTLRVSYPGWIRIGAGSPGSGTPIQCHVPVAIYRRKDNVPGGQPLAEVVHADWAEAGGPAVVRHQVGAGRAVLFFYDLAAAVARIRFGNPELASILTTGQWANLHACDLFTGDVDERTNHLPQADLHGQLLGKVLTDVSPAPLARLWYYERADLRSVAIVQSDDDWSTPEQFREITDCLRARDGRATFYLVHDTRLTAAEVDGYRAQGHTFAPHPNAHRCTDEWAFDFARILREETADFKRRFGACSATLQCHCAPWQGYMDWVPLFQQAGYRLLFTYLAGPPIYWHTYMCGSGRPIKFFDRQGRRHDCWQQPLNVYDDLSLIPLIRDHPQELIGKFEQFLADAVGRSFTAVPFLSHPISFGTYSRPFMEPCWDRVRQAGVPLLNGDEWLEFTDRRAAARITTETGPRGGARFQVTPVQGELSLMIPATRDAAIKVNDQPARGVAHHRRLEQDYAFVPLRGDGGTMTVEVDIDGRQL